MNGTKAYIVVEGVIGVGKTTLARMFQKEIAAQLVLEVFEENPYLSDFYTDRSRYAFQTQIFFLLSRYHQQRQLANMDRPLISDYMFQKDRLFAQVNLDGVELETYYSVQEALAENITAPDLIVFLKASTDTLMNRITARDRPYERNMEAAYIDSLRVAYDSFFSSYNASPVITIDTNNIDFVKNPDDRDRIFDQILGMLGQGPRQEQLPGLADQISTTLSSPAAEPAGRDEIRRLSVLQQMNQTVAQPSVSDPYLSFIQLQGEVGGLAKALVQRWSMSQAGRSLDGSLPAVREGLVDVFTHLLELANYADIDLEEAYMEKMQHNQSDGQDVMRRAVENQDGQDDSAR